MKSKFQKIEVETIEDNLDYNTIPMVQLSDIIEEYFLKDKRNHEIKKQLNTLIKIYNKRAKFKIYNTI